MGFEIPMDMQDPINELKVNARQRREALGARLNARQRGTAFTFFVSPSNGVLQDEWDAFDSQREYITTYTTADLVAKQRQKVFTVLSLDTGQAWRPEKPRRTGRKGHGTRHNRPKGYRRR